MNDMLEVEGQLDAAAEDSRSIAPGESEAGYGETASAHGGENFYSSKKSSTWKKFKKMMKTSHKPDGEGSILDAVAHQCPSTSMGGPTMSGGSITSQQVADDASEVASEMGRSSRTAYRYELGRPADGDESGKSTLKGMFKNKNKKSKQIELDALRFEMGMLQERHDLTERDLATYRHDVGTLRAERDHLANQVHELTVALTTVRTERDSAESERDRLKELHAQVKSALQETYSKEQGLVKQVKELEELCGAQQNSLEEAEERYRTMQQEHDQLHHTALAAKAQLVTAQAQLAEARTQREELVADLASLTSQATALQSEIDSRDEKMNGLELAAEQANNGLEAALGRLRELEAEQQQLEARVTLLQEENLELSTELSGVTELRRQAEMQLKEATAANTSLQAQLDRAIVNVDTLTARLNELNSQLASSSEAGGSLRMENSELMAELAKLREQQQQQQSRKQGSPLSKWRKGTAASGTSSTGGKPAVGMAAAAVPAAPASGNSSSTGPAEAASFSPMTSQLPAVRVPTAATAISQHVSDDDTTAQATCPMDATHTQADSSCSVSAAVPGSPEPTAGATAAVTATGADAAVAVGSAGELKPPIMCSTPVALEVARGPLTASRPTSRRQTGNGSSMAQQQQQTAAVERPAKVLAKSPRKLFNGEEIPEMQQSQRQQQDLFSRLFTCLAPQTVEMK